MFSSISITSGGGFDPYKILGVSRTASPDELKKRYRKLCLKYHPDKNVSKSAKEREMVEEKFKQVQAAYDMIENGPSRYQSEAGNSPPSGRFRSQSMADEVFRSKFGNFGDNLYFFSFEPGKTGRTYFGSQESPRFGMGMPFQSQFSAHDRTLHAFDTFKSLYVQSVKVPLEVLYKGVPNFRFKLKENLYTRYRASIRGKIILMSLYQAFLFVIPILRQKNRLLAYIAGLIIIHCTTPKPTGTDYFKPIRKGAKGGETSVKFINNEVEIEFQIEEGKHPIYRRQGDDLYTNVTITSAEAKKGCKKRLRPLDSSEEDIEITIPPKKYSYEKQIKNRKHRKTHSFDNAIKIRNKGWPILTSNKNDRNRSDVYRYGHLFVNVTVEKLPTKKR